MLAVAGFLDDRPGKTAATPADAPSAPVLGTVADFKDVALKQHVDDLYITIPSERAKVATLVEDASELGEDEDDMAEVIDNVEEEES